MKYFFLRSWAHDVNSKVYIFLGKILYIILDFTYICNFIFICIGILQ